VDEAGERLAEEVVTIQPRTLGEALEVLAQRHRFAGAAPFVSQLVSALALPPRRLAHHELPLGGYADVTTRGQPEQILPSQFAVDELEFVRRFAANELLYFHREEPHAQTREELVLLLDQGVRTWGSVRLVLGAAVLALGKLAVRRGIPFRVAVTSSAAETVDPAQVDPSALGELLEASDLSAHPGAALERMLEEPSEVARDVVLLSHPRNLGETDVAAAARRVSSGTRLFAVTVDDRGHGQLAEMKHGTPVRLSEFRVDMAQALTPPERPAERQRQAASSWTGDVEPIGFPFRFGIIGKLEANGFDFDQAGEWLLTVSSKGMLHAWRVDGTASEVLPRGWVLDEVLTQVNAVLGVSGGFVVAGRVKQHLVAVHYDFGRRAVRAYLMGAAADLSWRWYYFPELHSIVARDRTSAIALDLDTRGVYSDSTAHPALIARAKQACSEVQRYIWPPPRLYICPAHAEPGLQGPHLHLDSSQGRLQIGGTDRAWQPFIPLADGQPMLKGHRVLEAQIRGTVVVMAVASIQEPSKCRLLSFRLLVGTLLQELPYEQGRHFILSANGKHLARQVSSHWWEVRDLTGNSHPRMRIGPGKCHPDLDVELGDGWLTVRIGRRIRLLRWDMEELSSVCSSEDRNTFLFRELVHSSSAAVPTPNLASEFPSKLCYDHKRFRVGTRAVLMMLVDIFGQVAILDQSHNLVVMFYFFREKYAAWMPDGTRYGPASATGGPETPGALKKIGDALRQATKQARESVP
jgi:hypothetical protein